MGTKNIHSKKAAPQGWHRNTDLAVDLKTILRSDKRNPHVFRGRYITATRCDDGTPRLNFRPLPNGGRDFNLEHYALGVYNEICMALAGLIEEGK